MKVKVFEYNSNNIACEDKETEKKQRQDKFQEKVNDFLSQGHVIKQILQSSGGSYCESNRPAYDGTRTQTIITIFYTEKQ